MGQGQNVIPLTDRYINQWHMAFGTWFGETSRQSQAEPVKQQQTGISPNHVPEAVPYCKANTPSCPPEETLWPDFAKVQEAA